MYIYPHTHVQIEMASSSPVSNWGRGIERRKKKKFETPAHFALGYSCTDRLAHYLNIWMNTSVVLEELSAHLLLCICIAPRARQTCTGACACHRGGVCVHVWQSVSRSHQAAHLQQFLVLVKLQHVYFSWHSFVPSNLLMDELIISSLWVYVCVCVSVCVCVCVTGSI